MRTSIRFPCSLHEAEEVGKACFLYTVRVGMFPGVGMEGWRRWFAHPVGGGVCRGHAQYPGFLPSSSFCSRLFTSGSWVVSFVFWSLCIFVWNWPQLHMHKIILGAHAVSLHFVAGGDMCPCASIAAKGLRTQTVS